MPDVGLTLITGEDQLDRVIRWVVTTDMRDPGRYLTGGELVLTGLVWRKDDADTECFVAALAKAGVSALAAWDAAAGTVPADLVAACSRYRIPLFGVPEDVAFATLTEHIVRQLSTERTADLSAILDRHRKLVAGAGLGPILELIGTPCWVLTPSGRVIAGTRPLPPLDFAAAFLGAPRLPLVWQDHSLFGVDEDVSRVADWFVVLEGDWEDWPAERRALPRELAAIVSLERVRLDDRLSASGRLVRDLLALIVSDGPAADVPPGLKVTGLDPAGTFLIVAASAQRMLRPGEVRVVLREMLGDAVVGLVDDEVIAVVPAERDAAAETATRIRSAVADLTPGLRSGRSGLAVGVSGVVEAAGLRGAVEEARYARKLAEGRPDPGSVVGHDELGTHVLLLGSVPDDVRYMFRARLLDPLLDYDREHRADLVGTLETFLRCSGSWTRCGELLHLHVNSLRYRIQRIESLTGRDLSRLEDQVDFFLALQL
jgi:Purine catabolism regulatory protein-like family/PucR C-terminal helix-turn-helix domain/GGDEF-like domain